MVEIKNIDASSSKQDEVAAMKLSCMGNEPEESLESLTKAKFLYIRHAQSEANLAFEEIGT